MRKIYIKAGKERAIERKHPWIFSGALQNGHQKIDDGEIVQVLDCHNKVIAVGIYHPSSIAVRVLSFVDRKIDASFFNERIENAFILRKKINLTSNNNTNCFRLIHGEGDLLSGLIIDVYDRTAVIQCHTNGYLPFLKIIAHELLRNQYHRIEFVYNKSKEILKDKQNEPDGFIGNSGEKIITIKENDVLFEVNIESGQKTGFFIDQRENRLLLMNYALDKKVLNTFSYSGGFSLYALKGSAKFVSSIDISNKAIDLCNRNIALNSFQNHEGKIADVIEYIKEIGHDYDIIVLDPPAFAKHLSAKHKAVIGYKRINTEALKKIKNGGLIFTFSCSQAISRELFESTVLASAIEAKREVRILHRLTQPADHPVNIFHPEGNYLKGLVVYVG